LPADTVVDHLVSSRGSLGQRIEVSSRQPTPECASSLEPLEAPWTTELVIDCGGWAAHLNNGIDGGDPSAAAPYLSTSLGVRLVAALHAPRYGPGHSSTQFSETRRSRAISDCSPKSGRSGLP